MGSGQRALKCRKYHDEEWGVPCVDDKQLMEHIVLDGAQCGLSWRTIFCRRESYAKAFHNWNIEAMASMVRSHCSCDRMHISGEYLSQTLCKGHVFITQDRRVDVCDSKEQTLE